MMDDDQEHETRIETSAPVGGGFGSGRRWQMPGLNRGFVTVLGTILALFIAVVLVAIFNTVGQQHRPMAMASAQPRGPLVALDVSPAPLPSTQSFVSPSPTPQPTPTPAPPRRPMGSPVQQVCSMELQPGYVGEIDPICRDPRGVPASPSTAPQPQGGQGSRSDGAEQQREQERQAEQQARMQEIQSAMESGALLAASGSPQQQLGLGAPAAGTSPTPTPIPPDALRLPPYIPVTLVSVLDSLAPGSTGIVGHVRGNVLDESLTYTLIPDGAMAIGHVVSSTGAQGRFDPVWTEIDYPSPSHRILMLPDLHSTDDDGSGGVSGLVDDHRWNIIRTGLATTALAAGAALLTQPTSSTTNGSNNISMQTDPVNTAIAQGVQQTGDQVASLDLNRPHDTRAEAGKRIKIFVSQPIYVEPWNPQP